MNTQQTIAADLNSARQDFQLASTCDWADAVNGRCKRAVASARRAIEDSHGERTAEGGRLKQTLWDLEYTINSANLDGTKHLARIAADECVALAARIALRAELLDPANISLDE